VGGEAGAEGSRFEGIGVTFFLPALRDRAGLLVKLDTESRFEACDCVSSWSDAVCELIVPSNRSLNDGSDPILTPLRSPSHVYQGI